MMTLAAVSAPKTMSRRRTAPLVRSRSGSRPASPAFVRRRWAPQLDADPYPIYERLRREAPVCWVPAVDLWFITRWADVVVAAEDPVRFPASMPGSPLDRTLGGASILTVDGDELRVGTVVAGHFLRQDKTVLVTLEAVEVKDNRLVWTGTLTAPGDNLIALQNQLAKKVREELKAQWLPVIQGGLQALE